MVFLNPALTVAGRALSGFSWGKHNRMAEPPATVPVWRESSRRRALHRHAGAAPRTGDFSGIVTTG
jgi:hypothetical protein